MLSFHARTANLNHLLIHMHFIYGKSARVAASRGSDVGNFDIKYPYIVNDRGIAISRNSKCKVSEPH